MYNKILIAYDGSKGSKYALKSGVELSKILNAELAALWVAGSLPHYHETKAELDEETNYQEMYFAKLSNEIMEVSAKSNKKIEFTFIKGNAAKTLVEYAKENKFDLIIIGHSGHSNLWGRFLGHVPDKVSDNAHCDVLIVRNN